MNPRGIWAASSAFLVAILLLPPARGFTPDPYTSGSIHAVGAAVAFFFALVALMPEDRR